MRYPLAGVSRCEPVEEVIASVVYSAGQYLRMCILHYTPNKMRITQKFCTLHGVIFQLKHKATNNIQAKLRFYPIWLFSSIIYASNSGFSFFFVGN